jgi:hypothetical protein
VRRNSKIINVFRCKQTAQGTIWATDDGCPMVGTVDKYGNQWVSIANTGPTGTTIFSAPAAATQATVTQPAAGLGLRNVAQTITYSVAAVAAQPVLNLVLRDGASGVGTIIWQTTVGPIPIGASKEGSISVNIPGSTNTAMTLEFTAAPAAGNFETVALTSYVK